MIVVPASGWFPDWDKHPSWSHVIDLRCCFDETAIMRACAATLHGTESEMGGMRNEPNLNWLNDVVGDWFVEHWGEEKRILIAGAGNLFKVGPEFALSFMDVLNSGLLGAIYDRCQRSSGDGVVSEIQNTSITVVLN